MKSVFLYGILSIVLTNTFSQKVLTFDEYIALVKTNHPISYQANIQKDKGEAYLLKARGAFDPKLEAKLDQKNLNETQYYSHLHAGLKVPTWYGITVNADYENNTGTYLGNELKTAPEGVFAGGLSVTLGKGLFIDERRAELKQAKVYKNSTEIEQLIILNQLVLNASSHYWYWQKYHQEKLIYEQALENAKVRFEAVRNSVIHGDKPAIDSVEAKILVQKRQIKYQEATNQFKNYTLKLSTYLWQDGFIPLELDSLTTPEIILLSIYKPIINDSIYTSHPEIKLYDNKLEIQEIETSLMRESLKPTIDLKYNALSEITNQSFSDFNIYNNKFGAYFSYPIFIRKERGQVKIAKLEMQETQNDLELKKVEIRYKISASINNVETLNSQVKISQEALNNYKQLLDAEQILFQLGESSIFLINYREQAFLDAQIDLLEYQIKLKNAIQEARFILFDQ